MALELFLRIGDSLLTVVISSVFLYSFGQGAASRKKLLLLCIPSFFIVLISELVFYDHPFSYLMIFSGCMLLSLACFSNALHGVFYSCIFTVLLMTADTAAAALLRAGLVTTDGEGFSRLDFLADLSAKALTFLIVHLVYTLRYKPFSGEADKKYLVVVAFPLSSALAILTQNALLVQIEHRSPITVCLVLISDFALLFATLVVFEYINSLYELTAHKSRIEHANKIIEIQAAGYRSMVENSFETNKIKHDLRNFCIGIAAELKAGRVDEAIEKLCDIYGEGSPLKDDDGSGIEYILSAKAKKAAAVGVGLSFECVNIQNVRVSDVDLAIIIGNALDNAVEAAEVCPQKGTVEAFIVLRNNTLVIKIKNPIKGFVDVNDLSSTKADKTGHGFGIISMRRLVEKYGGEIIFKAEDGVFTASIIMNNGVRQTRASK